MKRTLLFTTAFACGLTPTFVSAAHGPAPTEVSLAAIAPAFVEPPAGAVQDGPPPEVRRAVTSAVQMLRADADALDAFIATMDLAPGFDRSALRARLSAAQAATRGRTESIGVEQAPGGVILMLSGPAGPARVRLTLSPRGVSDVALLNGGEQPGPDAAPDRNAPPSRRHFQALESLPERPLDEAVRLMEADHLSPAYLAETTAEQRRRTIESLRNAVARAGGLLFSGREGLFKLELRGSQEAEIQFRLDDAGRIRSLELVVSQPVVAELTPETLSAAFDKWAEEGLSGSVHVRRGGVVLLDRSYGTANADLGTKPTADTVFGIGSTPISFTIAAIDLLATRGVISLDDPVSKYFPEVPADKAGLTVRHLMSGRSGLPDFVHTARDRDPDLAWVDRDAVVARIVHAPLRFAPGTDRAHSHAAFVLLAAVIEEASEQSYYDFIRQTILDPAGMDRTGLYGETRGLKLSDFAVGSGPRFVGVPNIPPNWGPTSWLIMGSGGMFSTLNDMRKFFDYVEATPAFGPDAARRARSPGVEIGGSDGGYYFYRARNTEGDVAMMLLNTDGRTRLTPQITRALNKFILGEDTN